MNKRLTLVLVISLVLGASSGLALAADGNSQNQMTNEDIKANAGFQFGLIQFNFDELNNHLTNNGFGKLDENVFVWGGGSIGGLKKGNRFGGYGLGGTIKSTKDGKEVVFEVGLGGFLYERGIFVTDNADLAVGGLIGGGGATLNLIHDKPKDFGETVDSSPNTYLEKGFILLQPQATAHWQLSEGMGLDFVVGYMWTHDLGSNWKIGDQDIGGPMENLSAPMVSVELTFGL